MTKILYTVATDNNGKLVKANDAEKGSNYFCPVCKLELILRKSGKTGKGTKRPHFAHRTLTPNCTPETALHYSFKNLLAEKIQSHINSETPLPFSWGCNYCGNDHSGNLLKKVKEVEVEYNLKLCKPDIALLTNEGKVFGVIEVIVTHKPEESAIKYYADNKIVLIEIELTSDKDIDDLEEQISQPTKVRTCFNPKCETCGNYGANLKMIIIDSPCWKCDGPMKVASIFSSTGNGVRGQSNYLRPSDFTSEEINIAKSNGVILEVHYSKTEGRSYLANSCGNCDAFIGNHFLFTSYTSPAILGNYPSQEFDIGFHCDHCNELAEENKVQNNYW